jgi:hypothetical protein
MSAIATALRSTPITRLKLTYDQLPRDIERMIKSMDAFLNPSDNHNLYVTTLKDSKYLPCIPVLGKHVTSYENYR